MGTMNNRREALDQVRLAMALIQADYKLGDDLMLDNLREVEGWLLEEIAALQARQREG